MPPEQDAPPEDKRMTLAEHLEELRSRVLKSIIALVVALLVTMSFQKPIMKVIVWPHEKAMDQAVREKTVRVVGPDGEIVEGTPQPGPVKVAIGEGKDRRIIEGAKMEDKKLVVFGYPESFFLLFKLSLVAAAALAAPVILVQMWRFISAGLYKKERRLVYIYGPASIVLFAAGVCFGYFVLIPVSLHFLATYAIDMVDPMFNLSQYVNLVFMLTLALGVVFEMPLMMHFATRLEIITPEAFAKKRRLAVVLIVVGAAILTPTGDPWTLILMSGPMYLLYELGLLLCRATAAKRAAAKAGSA
jgi:Tat protein translocase TatC